MSQFRFQSFSLLPPVIKNLLIINGLMYFLTISDLTSDFGLDFEEYFALYHWNSTYFRPWQFITYMFMHADIWHLIFNMFGLWMFGYVIENLWGSKRFLNFYLLTGVGSALFFLLTKEIQIQPYIGNVPPELLERFYNIKIVGASGALYAVLMAYGMRFPNSIVHLYFLIPVKMKWLIAGLIAYSLIREASGSQDGIAHFAHLGGMLVGFLIIKYWKRNNYLY